MSKRIIIRSCFLIIFLFWGCESEKQSVPDPLHNILFIAVDDLRPELGVYGNQIIKTPNIDQLANAGSLFTKHYVQVPTCGASRYSMMTGMRPRKRVHIGNDVFYKETANQSEKEQPESFVHHFKRNGYTTVGIGKLSHSVDGLVYGYKEQPSEVKEMPTVGIVLFSIPGNGKQVGMPFLLMPMVKIVRV